MSNLSIRSAAKAVIIKDNMLLLNKCYDSTLGEYYDLPGGGQNQYETIEEAIKRECLEETGYSICVGQFLAVFSSLLGTYKCFTASFKTLPIDSLITRWALLS